MKVKLTGEFATLTGKREVEIFTPTNNIMQLLKALDNNFPNYGWDNCNVAINGTMYSNAWMQPISWKGEVVIMPFIEGG